MRNAPAGSNMSEHTPTFFPTPADFRAWLEQHHATTDHLWVGYYKKATNKPSVTWEDTVDEALCFGWIDGVRKTRDPESYTIRFTPRKSKSVWSQRNIDLVERLNAEGRMKPEGLAAFALKDEHPDSGYATANFDGSLPESMVAQFKQTPGAWEFYEAQPPGYRKHAGRWVTSAKREETRTRRLATLIEDSGNQLRIKQLRKS
ncbi:MAG: YdeI/OmpD-associated family protein [Nannocystales bacterium]